MQRKTTQVLRVVEQQKYFPINFVSL